jgi:hypothetical protein
MSRKPENVFISSVHNHLPPKLHREKMANPYRGGTPDVWYSGDKADLWVEYKFVILPKRADTVIDVELSPLQWEWITRRHLEGRHVAVIVGCKEGAFVWGADPNELRKLTLTRSTFLAGVVSRAKCAEWIASRTLKDPCPSSTTSLRPRKLSRRSTPSS